MINDDEEALILMFTLNEESKTITNIKLTLTKGPKYKKFMKTFKALLENYLDTDDNGHFDTTRLVEIFTRNIDANKTVPIKNDKGVIQNIHILPYKPKFMSIIKKFEANKEAILRNREEKIHTIKLRNRGSNNKSINKKFRNFK